jgi:glyoxylase-like metal-dependent hydrolase (beta-lactamase superfamily II)
MRIIPLSEGAFTIDSTKEFIPFDKENDELQERAKGSLLVEIQPFLLITEKEILLLDTGLGFTNKEGILQLHENIATHGIHPSQVTKVLMSHLHKDHAGGMVVFDTSKNEYQAAFPQATYYINRKEWTHAFEIDSPSYNPQKLACLNNISKLIFLEEDKGTIDGLIHYELSSGHSPFHQVFHIIENDEIVFFGGDEAPQLQQMKTRFVAKYDQDGKRAMELRKQWWEQGEQGRWTFLFYHDIKTPTFKFSAEVKNS